MACGLRMEEFSDYALDNASEQAYSRSMNLIDAIKTFPDELACVRYLEKMRWPEGVKCVKCGSEQVTFYTKKEGVRARVNRKGERVEVRVPARYLYQCKACRHQFTPTVGTLFNDTHLPLRTWFLAVVLMIDAKKSMAANQIKRHLDIGSYRTAWYLCHRVRKAMEELPDDAGVEEAMDRLYLLYKVERGLLQADRGELISQEEVRQRMAKWRSKVDSPGGRVGAVGGRQ